MSILEKEIRKEVELSENMVQAGFNHAYSAGEYIAEVENLVGADKLKEWFKQNLNDIEPAVLRQCLRLFKGEKVKLEVYKKEGEVQTEPE